MFAAFWVAAGSIVVLTDWAFFIAFSILCLVFSAVLSLGLL
jgi:hypothetical protein